MEIGPFSMWRQINYLHNCSSYASKNNIDLKFTDISSTNDPHQIFILIVYC